MTSPNAPAAPAASEKTILIVGMHRSGTSMLTRLIHTMGAHAGEPTDLIPRGLHDNPHGYWERNDVLNEHEKILAFHGYAWNSLAHFRYDRLDFGYRRAFIQRAAQWRRKVNTGGRPFVLKDPRACLLLPAWQEALRNPVCVFSVRDPRVIATSICTPQRGSYPGAFVLALWEKYMQQALEALRGKRVLFVRYERLIRNPQSECARIAAGVARLGVPDLQSPASGDLDGLIDTRLNRSKPSPQAILTGAQQALLNWLDAQCAAVGPTLVAALPRFDSPDQVLARFQVPSRLADRDTAANAPQLAAMRYRS